MGNDIQKARRRRLRAARTIAFSQWVDRFEIDIRISWPRGVAGTLLCVGAMFAPVILWVAIIATLTKLIGGKPPTDDPNDNVGA